MHGQVLSSQVTERSLLQQDLLKFAKLRLLVTKPVYHRKPKLRHFDPIVTKTDIFFFSIRLDKKKFRASRKSQPHFLESTGAVDVVFFQTFVLYSVL